MTFTFRDSSTGQINTLDIPHLSTEEFVAGHRALVNGVAAHCAYPQLSDEEREFMVSGKFPVKQA